MNTNLLFIISSLKKGGPVNQLYELLSTYPFLTHPAITVLSLSPLDIPNSRSYDFLSLGHKVVSLQFDGYNFYKIATRIKQYIRENNIDNVISQGIRADISLALLSPENKTRYFTILHNYIGPDYRFTYKKYIALIMTFLHTIALKRLKIIAVSESVSEFILKKYNLRSIVIRNGVTTRENHSKNTLTNCIKLVYVGIIDKRKRVHELISCFSRLKHENLTLDIIGSGEIQNQAIKNDNVLFLGFRNDVHSILPNYNIFVSFSLYEGLPMAALEALSMQIPCILSDIPPHREIISLSANFGCIYDINDNHSFEKAIEYCLSIEPSALKIDYDKLLSSAVMASAYYALIDNH
ncbi:glycosyltransferase family 4 protein [Enterobacter chuandaensis]|uniref:Glycosyltransferase family 4 protein n=1 Tax=Enterobacter chuandaensis TaxID=2497875 RepID=A0AA96MC22_9ENTR|nr:glycosyltransferase family 4 protein [Enterobacter chuandaensis]MCW4781409.1 glycosyltransferase family 4 protein [Enterobacter chuandaensis]MDA4759261.1 glycosyltransferase family 4 protein [Enterobacter chuandaensis]WNS39522.1 glycosyltransferase family 4 protein [Enterobacter chuandaensis]